MADSQRDPVIAQLERQKLTASPLTYYPFSFTQPSRHLAHCEPELCRRANATLRECYRPVYADADTGSL